MTNEEILNNAKYIQFPLLGGSFQDYSQCGKDIVKLPLTKDDQYLTWQMNQHHVKTMSHFHKIMPVLSDLLKFNFNENDFHIVNEMEGNHDVSYPYPNKEYRYDIRSLYRDEKFVNVPYEEFFVPTNSQRGIITKYHKLYKYAHESSTVENLTNRNGRRLFILGDSQTIPLIPILSIYFEHISYLDNRNHVHVMDKLREINYTDTLVQLFSGTYDHYVRQQMI